MKVLIEAVRRPEVIRNALRVSAVVGTILNLINQGDRLPDLSAISWPHVLLNYLVPYVVASYSAARMELEIKENETCDRKKG